MAGTGTFPDKRATNAPRPFWVWLVGVLTTILQVMISIPISLLWILHSTIFIFIEKREKDRIHKNERALPPAWRFYQLFKDVPKYTDYFKRLAANNSDTAWAAEVVVGYSRVYCITLTLPVHFEWLKWRVMQKGSPEYFIVEGMNESKQGFEVKPGGFQKRLSEEGWKEVSKDFAHPETVGRAIDSLRKPPTRG